MTGARPSLAHRLQQAIEPVTEPVQRTRRLDEDHRKLMALTVLQPWAWCICYQGKGVENRRWAPPQSQLRVGDDLVIHAGLEYLGDIHSGRQYLGGASIPDRKYWARPHLADPRATSVPRGAVVAVATYRGHVRYSYSLPPDQQAWWIGPIGWLLDDVRVLAEPVPCRGAQRLWAVPPDVEAAIRAQVGEVR